jgi:hypothetical protein
MAFYLASIPPTITLNNSNILSDLLKEKISIRDSNSLYLRKRILFLTSIMIILNLG